MPLIYVFTAISELPDSFLTSVKIVQRPYTSLFQYAFGLYFTLGFPGYPFLDTLISLYPFKMLVNFVSYREKLEEQ